MIVFLFVHASGDPAALLVPEQATAADAANYRKALRLDRPIYEQYVQFMSHFGIVTRSSHFAFNSHCCRSCCNI
jgi:ABC-type dipeptide/oligopeptide/nickel transport system permease component